MVEENGMSKNALLQSPVLILTSLIQEGVDWLWLMHNTYKFYRIQISLCRIMKGIFKKKSPPPPFTDATCLCYQCHLHSFRRYQDTSLKMTLCFCIKQYISLCMNMQHTTMAVSLQYICMLKILSSSKIIRI